jgi:hypothetical protein
MDRLEEAIIYADSQEAPNYTEIARKFNVTRTTLWRRHTGQTVSRAAATSALKKLLTDSQENEIIDYINKLTARGFPPTPQILENIIVERLKAPIGGSYIRKFVKRHNDRIQSVYLRTIDNARKIADNSKHFEHFYVTVIPFYLTSYA